MNCSSRCSLNTMQQAPLENQNSQNLDNTAPDVSKAIPVSGKWLKVVDKQRVGNDSPLEATELEEVEGTCLQRTDSEPFNLTSCDFASTTEFVISTNFEANSLQKGKHLSVSTQKEENKLHVCLECGKTFTAMDSLLTHKEIHLKTAEKPVNFYLCLHCDEKFNCPASLNSHKRSEHSKSPKLKMSNENQFKKKNLAKNERKWACQICGKTFCTPRAFRDHEVVHTGARDFPCNICGKAFGTAANMRIHRLTHSDQRPFTCLTCSATFRQKDSLKVHLRKHTGERPYQCSVCHMTFDRNFTLKNHMLTHASEKSYVCSACGKAFATRGGLNNHERLHFKDPPQLKRESQPRAKPGTGNWVCDECGKIYSTRSNLHIHQKSHKPSQVCFTCPVCSKVYKSRDSLEVHKRRHTEERPYCCSVCSRSFYRNYTLKLHILTHTGEKPHHCPVEGCTKSFAQSSSLSYHIRNHQKQKEVDSTSANGKRQYRKRKSLQENFIGDNELRTSSSVSVIRDHEKEIKNISAGDLSMIDDLKFGGGILTQQSIISDVVLNETPVDSGVHSMLDLSNSMAPPIVDSLAPVWNEHNSITMMGVANGIHHAQEHSDHSFDLELHSQHCQQIQLMHYVPPEPLPFLVSSPESILYQDNADKTFVGHFVP